MASGGHSSRLRTCRRGAARRGDRQWPAGPCRARPTYRWAEEDGPHLQRALIFGRTTRCCFPPGRHRRDTLTISDFPQGRLTYIGDLHPVVPVCCCCRHCYCYSSCRLCHYAISVSSTPAPRLGRKSNTSFVLPLFRFLETKYNMASTPAGYSY